MFTRQKYDNCYNKLNCKSTDDYTRHQFREGETCHKKYDENHSLVESNLLGISNKGNRNCNNNIMTNSEYTYSCDNINSISTRSILNNPNRGINMFNNPTTYGNGNGNGHGHGSGNGNGHGSGSGNGNGNGHGSGNGSGHGHGSGNGHGHGGGHGSGNGSGDGNFISLFPNILPLNNPNDKINKGNYSFPKCSSINNDINLDTSRCIYNKFNDATRICGKSSRLDSKNKFSDMINEYSKITPVTDNNNVVHPSPENVQFNGNFNCK